MRETAPPRLRERLLAGERLLGSFLKTPTPHATEILGSVGFDFVVIDEEHAPIDRGATDMILLGCTSSRHRGLGKGAVLFSCGYPLRTRLWCIGGSGAARCFRWRKQGKSSLPAVIETASADSLPSGRRRQLWCSRAVVAH